MSFIFGGNTGLSHSQAQALQGRAAQSRQAATRAPYRGPADLISPAGHIIASLVDDYRGISAEKAGREKGDAAFQALLGDESPSLQDIAGMSEHWDGMSGAQKGVFQALLGDTISARREERADERARAARAASASGPAARKPLTFREFGGELLGIDPLTGAIMTKYADPSLAAAAGDDVQSTQSERQAAARLERARASVAELGAFLDETGFEGPGFWDEQGGVLTGFEATKSQEWRSYERMMELALEPLLRDDTGAAATEEERAAKRRQYMWSYYDTPEQRQAKLAALRRDIESLSITSGRAKDAIRAEPLTAASAYEGVSNDDFLRGGLPD